MRCENCDNYLIELNRCKFCHFEKADNEPWEWNILELDDSYGWSHLQILERLEQKGIECLSADIWFNNNMAYLVTHSATSKDIAKALNLHEEVVYENQNNGLIILNLYQEKILRKKEN